MTTSSNRQRDRKHVVDLLKALDRIIIAARDAERARKRLRRCPPRRMDRA